jgi:hypothetical protein
VSLADTCCGYATVRNLAADAKGFTTLELKSNFLGTALEATSPASRGRSTRAGRRTSGMPRFVPKKTGKTDRILPLHADDPALRMLQEIHNTYQAPDEPPRRFFFSHEQDLWVWFSEDGALVAFQARLRQIPRRARDPLESRTRLHSPAGGRR